jgi:uncharacterized phage protein gp47/JayE
MTTIPTISELYNRILTSLETEYSVSIPLVGKNFLRILASVLAVQQKMAYLKLGSVQKNIFIDTADPESKGGTLERFGRTKLGRNPFAAIAAQYEIEVTGDVGAVIKASSTFKSNDDSNNPGQLYVLDVEYTLVSSPDTITVRALEAGLSSSLNDGDELTATAPIANVNSLATVTDEVVEPRAAEETETYRQAGINAYRLEPQGGAASDYRLWAQDAQGVERVYPYNKSGATAEINLFIEATLADSDDGKGTPTAGIIADVEEVINRNPDTTLNILERGRRPMQVIVDYLPVTIIEVDIVISDFIGSTAAIEALIISELTSQISEIRPFVSGADILDINKIISAILIAKPGSIFGSVDLQIDGDSVSTYTFENGDIPHLNSITYL